MKTRHLSVAAPLLAAALAAFAVLLPLTCLAAVSCTLDRPDRDVRRLVPEATTYKVRELLPFRNGDADLLKRVSHELEGKLDPEYETPTTPYTFYVVYKNVEQIALILGVNARAMAGPMQLFVVYDPKGKITDVYVQKLSSPDAPLFRSKYYRSQYFGFGLDRIPGYANIRPPVRDASNDTLRDHDAFLRSVRFNSLIVRDLYNKQAPPAGGPSAASGASGTSGTKP